MTALRSTRSACSLRLGLLGVGLFAGAALGGCVAYPAGYGYAAAPATPYYGYPSYPAYGYGPAYAYAPPVVGGVFVGDGGYWRGGGWGWHR